MKKSLNKIIVIYGLLFNHLALAHGFPALASIESGGNFTNDNTGFYLNSQLTLPRFYSSIPAINAGLTVSKTENYNMYKMYLGLRLPLETMDKDTFDVNFSISNRGSSVDVGYRHYFSESYRVKGYYLSTGYSFNFRNNDYSHALIGVGYVF